MADAVLTNRVYEAREPGDGRRVLVDRLWPRGIAKVTADWDEWVAEAAPSTELRRWYGHAAERYDEFRERYRAELSDTSHAAALAHLRELAAAGTVTLLTATRDVAHSHLPTLVAELSRRADEAG